MKRSLLRMVVLISALGLGTSEFGAAQEWASWRGPTQDGVSTETGLIDSWSKDGENLVWRADFTGRSTPVVFDGRTCAIGRVGVGVDEQEVVSCWDAGTGEKRWERRFNVYHTTVPFSRVGWASVSGDPETGYLYAHGVGGQLWCLDRDGKTVWEWRLGEDVGRYSGYGGRTHTPIVDQDQVILTVIGINWGDQAPPRHRYFSFDKRSGEVLWVSSPGGRPADLNTYSTPVVTMVDGQRLLIGGACDGGVYALKTRTGEKVWGFKLSKRGINVSPVVSGNTVYIAHSEENMDEGTLGRVVALDASTGKEKWRSPQSVGYASPLVHEGVLYVVDNSANLHALDADTGKDLWKHNFGTVGKSSPVWADGKIYVTEVNGGFHILKLGEEGVTVLDAEHIAMPEGRYAEVYGSPAVAYGRVYFATENGIFCLGDKAAPFEAKAGTPRVLAEESPAEDAEPAVLRVVPAEVVSHSGETIDFEVRAFDSKGRALGTVEAQWSLQGLRGTVKNGAFTTDKSSPTQAGRVIAKAGGLEASARARVVAQLPLSEDFEGIEVGKGPANWVGVFIKAKVREIEGAGKVLVKPRPAKGVPRANFYAGSSDMSGYTVQADLLGTQERRRRPDMGLIASGYILDLQGNHQRLQIRSWSAELRMAETLDFAWESGVWYTMKMRVDQIGDKAVIRGKVWKRSEEEPAEWSITAQDPHPIRSGSPGLYGYSPVDIYYDNFKVTVSQ